MFNLQKLSHFLVRVAQPILKLTLGVAKDKKYPVYLLNTSKDYGGHTFILS